MKKYIDDKITDEIGGATHNATSNASHWAIYDAINWVVYTISDNATWRSTCAATYGFLNEL